MEQDLVLLHFITLYIENYKGGDKWDRVLKEPMRIENNPPKGYFVISMPVLKEPMRIENQAI